MRRDTIQLETELRSLKEAEETSASQAAAVASGEDDHPESALADLRARHQARTPKYTAYDKGHGS